MDTRTLEKLVAVGAMEEPVFYPHILGKCGKCKPKTPYQA
jgi:hypothetical protein